MTSITSGADIPSESSCNDEDCTCFTLSIFTLSFAWLGWVWVAGGASQGLCSVGLPVRSMAAAAGDAAGEPG
eukprot:14274247-Heterocapsa_arctica.AAC.1